MKKKIDLAAAKYKHIIRDMPVGFFPSASAEFLIGKALMQDGMLSQYVDHPKVKQVSVEIQEYLKLQLATPWRYIFGRIAARPGKEFFVFRDEILGDELLIYSPGIQANCQEGHEQSLFFLLVGNNGECWQTFGLIISFMSFDIEDIYIYGTEVFNEVEDDESFMRSVYKDPFPYFMLFFGQKIPEVFNANVRLRNYVGEQEIHLPDTEKLKKHFTVQWNRGIFKFTLDKWSELPHYASAYFIEKENLLYRYAMSEEGFDVMTDKLIQAGLVIPKTSDYSIGLPMVSIMGKIFKRDFPINPYEKYFPEANASQRSSEDLTRTNKFLGLLIPFINSGEQPNLTELARKSGINLMEAEEIYKVLRNKYGNY